ncbi:PIG-L deacetylase family protein [Actinokineospora iranica]|uniref:N-acetylglucosaminyl deacetylase, LmbE family n=1 Tax=Actinokineospora iranica TaxID=1271860 RepID=A0A1G6JUC5_9PSEU|nr:PIG-L family deacetylase [Actinokineospora iranica]SDC22352.1 N-acetylglucosaminyl deacetylase, LmbE family [Actinokineospora iranica]
MNVLAVGAHPDDVEILCAGTLARYRRTGHAVGICVLTNGDLGAPDGEKVEIAAVRAREARRSADVLDARLFLLGEPDGFLFDSPETRIAFAEVLRAFRPDILFIPDPHDYHPDHRAASAIALNSLQLAASPLQRTESAAIESLPAVFYMDTLALVGATPRRWVDISETLDTKLDMLRAHRSQNDWLRCTDGTDYLDYVVKQARLRGLQCGTAAAEAFRVPEYFPINHAASTLPELPA